MATSWEVVAAEITGLALGAPSSETQFSAKVRKGGTTYLLEVPWWAVPEEVLKLYAKKSIGLDDFRGCSAELLTCSPVNITTGKRREADPWVMRNEFFQLKRNTKSLLTFLNRRGAWGTTQMIVGSPEPVNVSRTARRLGKGSMHFKANCRV